MGVIRCHVNGSAFAIVICPKAGSTTLRFIFEKWADEGQYVVDRDATMRQGQLARKLGDWSVSGRYQGDDPEDAWAVVRNPYQRILSKWREKRVILGGTRPWPSYVSGAAGRRTGVIAKPQWDIVKRVPLNRIFALSRLGAMLSDVNNELGTTAEKEHKRSHGEYDWRAPYREHPETVGLVRDLYAQDWKLGIDWEDPLES